MLQNVNNVGHSLQTNFYHSKMNKQFQIRHILKLDTLFHISANLSIGGDYRTG